jgi:glycosyltransferase involved in cell wall biosynthesis
MVIAEAMAAAVPVVATRVGGVAHLVQENRSGYLVEVGDIDTLAQRIGALLADERTRASFAAAARSAAAQFRPAAVAARVRAVYQEAVG